jgi:hypothetical protein
LGFSNWPVIYYTFPRQFGSRSFLSPLPCIEEEAFTPSSPRHHHHCCNLCALPTFCIAPVRNLLMRVKPLAEKNKMVKGKAVNASTSWVTSAFMQKDLDKAKANGLISDSDSVIFPSTERIPKPKSGFRVMFLAFLLRGLSLPAHEFLRGLLYVYGVQLHQLTPNSLLHIACFITLCESFLGTKPHFIRWRSLFRLHPSVSLSKKPELGGAVISVRAESQYLEFSMATSVQGWRTKWFYIKDRKVSSSDEYDLALLMPPRS